MAENEHADIKGILKEAIGSRILQLYKVLPVIAILTMLFDVFYGGKELVLITLIIMIIQFELVALVLEIIEKTKFSNVNDTVFNYRTYAIVYVGRVMFGMSVCVYIYIVVTIFKVILHMCNLK